MLLILISNKIMQIQKMREHQIKITDHRYKDNKRSTYKDNK